MPTGYYTLQEEKNNYKKETRYSRESIQWLEHVMCTTRGVSIQHDSITFPLTPTMNRLERYTNTMGVFGTVILVTLPTMRNDGRKRWIVKSLYENSATTLFLSRALCG